LNEVIIALENRTTIKTTPIIVTTVNHETHYKGCKK
jgi:hypothetical protein